LAGAWIKEMPGMISLSPVFNTFLNVNFVIRYFTSPGFIARAYLYQLPEAHCIIIPHR
jgi:hypothetical protein